MVDGLRASHFNLVKPTECKMQSCSFVFFVLVNNKHVHALNTKRVDYGEYVPFKSNYAKFL